MFNAIGTALSGVLAAGKKVEASASNIANAGVTGSLDKNDTPQPYQPVETVQATGENGEGVIARNVPSQRPSVPVFDPDASFADESGFVAAPGVNLAEESANLLIAKASFESNLAVLQTVSDLTDELLNLFDDQD